jgi:hypothetical protein
VGPGLAVTHTDEENSMVRQLSEFGTLAWVTLALTASLGACTCGGGSVSVGGHCLQQGDCSGGNVCVDSICAIPESDGGFYVPLADGGQLNVVPDAGSFKFLPDGGLCQGLQCNQAACTTGQNTTLTGKVYDPSGTVPLYNAIVYVPNGPVQPFKSGLSCDSCASTIEGQYLVATQTDTSGAFTLVNVPAGIDFPLVYQIGKWRRQVTIPAMTACSSQGVPEAPGTTNNERLPRDRSEGDLPLIAISTGNADPLECLLYKMNISKSEITDPQAATPGRIQVYQATGGPGAAVDSNTPPDTSLWTSSSTLNNYDLVLLPCEGGQYDKPAGAVTNIINYATAGGRVFTTHYGYVWTDPLSASPATFTTDPWYATGTAAWAPDPNLSNITNSNANTNNFNLVTSFPKGAAFADWLTKLGASTGNTISLTQWRDDVNDTSGTPAYPSTTWIHGTNPKNSAPLVQHLTYNMPITPISQPDGGSYQCGRVVYSDFHIIATSGGGGTYPHECAGSPGQFNPQELALLFMLFDVSACIQSDSQVSSVCPTAGQACSTSSPCCSGLICGAGICITPPT